MILVPSFSPPPRFVRVPCSPEHLARLISPFVLFSSSPSINAYSAAPLQCLVPPTVHTPSSVRWRATNPPAPADQCPLLVPRPSVPYAGLNPPPRPIPLVLLGLGVGWGGQTERRTPCKTRERIQLLTTARFPGRSLPDESRDSRLLRTAGIEREVERRA